MENKNKSSILRLSESIAAVDYRLIKENSVDQKTEESIISQIVGCAINGENESYGEQIAHERNMINKNMAGSQRKEFARRLGARAIESFSEWTDSKDEQLKLGRCAVNILRFLNIDSESLRNKIEDAEEILGPPKIRENSDKKAKSGEKFGLDIKARKAFQNKNHDSQENFSLRKNRKVAVIDVVSSGYGRNDKNKWEFDNEAAVLTTIVKSISALKSREY